MPPPADAIAPASLVEIPGRDAAELICLALGLTKGQVRRSAIAREANGAVADRLLEYFRQSGIVLMRPPPRPAHSNNPRAGQSDALAES